MITIGVGLKMYLGYKETLTWCRRVAELAADHGGVRGGDVELFVLPSPPMIAPAIAAFTGTEVRVGAQDLSEHDVGPYTGEVSGAMLAELGCELAEVGHAERRRLHGETGEVVAAKAVASLRNGLVPVLCIGERDRIAPESAADSCIRELRSITSASRAAGCCGRLIVAYEPEWAIGATEPAPADHIRAVCALLAAELSENELHPSSTVIYGGSAGPGLLTGLGKNIDGLFLGRFAHNVDALAAVLDEAVIVNTTRLAVDAQRVHFRRDETGVIN